jgi:hypothetical protein
MSMDITTTFAPPRPVSMPEPALELMRTPAIDRARLLLGARAYSRQGQGLGLALARGEAGMEAGKGTGEGGRGLASRAHALARRRMAAETR